MIHTHIQKARKEAKITQSQLSKQTGIPTRRIIAIEAGKGSFSLIELEAILTAVRLKLLLLPEDMVKMNGY